MGPLASVADLEARLGRDLATEQQLARASALLADASAAVRSYTGQQFSRATSTVRVNPPVRGAILLPQRPVNNVTAVTSAIGNIPQQFLWDGLNLYVGAFLAGVVVNASANYHYYEDGRRPPVIVTYDHGYDDVPQDVLAVVCQIAGRAMGRPLEDSGVQQEALGSYSYSTGVAAAAGGVGMLKDERAVLDIYRRQAGVTMATLPPPADMASWPNPGSY